jgi:hypothetical protein
MFSSGGSGSSGVPLAMVEVSYPTWREPVGLRRAEPECPDLWSAENKGCLMKFDEEKNSPVMNAPKGWVFADPVGSAPLGTVGFTGQPWYSG